MAEDEPTNPDHCLWQLRCLRGQVYVWCRRGVKRLGGVTIMPSQMAINWVLGSKMLKEFRIKNFRGLEDVTLRDLGRINLIGGKNGSGKTSVLEAMWMFAAPGRPDIAYRVTGFRGLNAATGATVFRDLFNQLDPEKRIELSGVDGSASDSGKLVVSLREHNRRLEPFGNGSAQNVAARSEYSQALSSYEIVFDFQAADGTEYSSTGIWAQETQVSVAAQTMEVKRGIHVESTENIEVVPASFSLPKVRQPQAQIATNFGAFQLDRQESNVLEFVRAIGPRVMSLVPVTLEGEVILHAEIEDQKGLYPVNLLGEGAFRILEFATSIAQIDGGRYMIDEIENGLHYTVLVNVFKRLYELADHHDVQVFATTHSWECVKAAHDALGPVGGKFNYHRIGRRDGNAKAVSYDEDMLNTAFEVGWEIR